MLDWARSIMRSSGDLQIGAALRALHADPARQWTVADLAAAAALSRSAFARRFVARCRPGSECGLRSTVTVVLPT